MLLRKRPSLSFSLFNMGKKSLQIPIKILSPSPKSKLSLLTLPSLRTDHKSKGGGRKGEAVREQKGRLRLRKAVAR